jgi:hypothetical protein
MEELHTIIFVTYYIYVGMAIIASLMAYFWIPKMIKLVFNAEEETEEG